MDRTEAKQRVEKFVQTFQRELREKINEAETRLRFIDPFFEALGWDIRNPKEVRVESPLPSPTRGTGILEAGKRLVNSYLFRKSMTEAERKLWSRLRGNQTGWHTERHI
jgi:hypothetical protein